jgi:hypothetical protein
MSRKLGFILIVSAFIFTLTLSDCGKESEETERPEYLEKYLGDWDFQYIKIKREYPVFYSSDTTLFKGEIIYGSCEGCITVIRSGSVFSTYKVEPDGQILNSCEPPSLPLHYIRYCKGYFEGDTILHYETFDQTPPNRIITNIATLKGTKM